MQSMLNMPDGPAAQLPVMVVAELQDYLLMVMHDLNRLEGLLDHATANLLARFGEAHASLTDALVGERAELAALRGALRGAVTELQFHDMATQLLSHSGKVLQACAFRLAAEVVGTGDGEEPAPLADMTPARPNPVTQSEMAAGSVELF